MGPRQISLEEAAPGAQGLINTGAGRAMQDVDSFANRTNAGAAERANTLGSSDQSLNQEAASTAQDPAYMKALRNSYSGQASAGIESLKKQNHLQAQFQKSEDLRRMAMMALGQQQAITANYGAVTNAYIANEQARAQMVSQVFGAVNTFQGINAANKKGNQNADMDGAQGINQYFNNSNSRLQMPNGYVSGQAPQSQSYMGTYNF
jgi:hypothetical protein